jgi:hypothetical protein
MSIGSGELKSGDSVLKNLKILIQLEIENDGGAERT